MYSDKFNKKNIVIVLFLGLLGCGSDSDEGVEFSTLTPNIGSNRSQIGVDDYDGETEKIDFRRTSVDVVAREAVTSLLVEGLVDVVDVGVDLAGVSQSGSEGGFDDTQTTVTSKSVSARTEFGSSVTTNSGCDLGGSIDIVFNSLLSITLDYNNCFISQADQIDGEISISLFLNDDEEFQFEIDTNYTRISETSEEISSFTSIIDSLVIPEGLDQYSVIMDALIIDNSDDSLVQIKDTYLVVSDAAKNGRVDARGTLLIEEYGALEFNTTESIVFSDNGNPNGGQLVLEGADNYTMTIEFQDGNTGTLSYDVEGDGIIDGVSTFNW